MIWDQHKLTGWFLNFKEGFHLSYNRAPLRARINDDKLRNCGKAWILVWKDRELMVRELTEQVGLLLANRDSIPTKNLGIKISQGCTMVTRPKHLTGLTKFSNAHTRYTFFASPFFFPYSNQSEYFSDMPYVYLRTHLTSCLDIGVHSRRCWNMAAVKAGVWHRMVYRIVHSWNPRHLAQVLTFFLLLLPQRSMWC